MSSFPMPPGWVIDALQAGLVIPAHPLALTAERGFDERRQRALTRYYHAAGAGGVAVAVHTTQFEIREPRHALLRPVLELASETVRIRDAEMGRRTVLVAGVCGATSQAVVEARQARELGYHVGLLSLAALGDATDDALITHCRTVAREIPLFGFYLQPKVGGRDLSVEFWRRFAEIPNVVGVKIAPFDRYRTFDVIRAVAEVGRERDIALYTGNDDSIVVDLLTQFVVNVQGKKTSVQIVGGLLGHWACGTRRAVDLLAMCKDVRQGDFIASDILTLATQVTDCNAAYFDAANNFAGCIPGIHEVLRRQGLLENTRCLDPTLALSNGQAEEISRVTSAYPYLTDDEFVAQHLDEWLR